MRDKIYFQGNGNKYTNPQLTKSYRNVKLNYPQRQHLKPNALGPPSPKHVHQHYGAVLPNVVRFPNSTFSKDNKERGLERLATLAKTFANDDFTDDIEGDRFQDDRDRYFNPNAVGKWNSTKMPKYSKPIFLGQNTYSEFQKKYPTLTRLLQTTSNKMNKNIPLEGNGFLDILPSLKGDLFAYNNA